jgi:hypothetical protein
LDAHRRSGSGDLESTTPSLISGSGAYRTVSIDSAKGRWLKGVAEEKKRDLIPARWFEQWAEATWATDPLGAQQSPRTLRAPNGVIADIKDFWAAGKPLYDPSQIRAATLLVHAERSRRRPRPRPVRIGARLARALGIIERPSKSPFLIGLASRFLSMSNPEHASMTADEGQRGDRVPLPEGKRL